MTSDAATPIPSTPPGVTVTTLDNGLTIIVREDHSAPVVSAQAWCMAGSVHEGKWLGAGLSHVLEHMLFKGTTTRPGSRIDQEVQEAGGYMNAYTSFDRTVYHIDVPNTGTRVAVDILCDIMQNATLPPDELAKEMDVIVREMDMNVDDPGRRASRRLFETAYTRSPYRFTVIGYPDIFHELKPEDIHSYYREKYAPNNVFYVVAGDVKPDAIAAQIREAYAKSKAKPLPPVVLPEEPAQTASREIIEEAPIELGNFHMAWHIPDLRHPDLPGLDVLAALLGHGRSSRLYQEVREKKELVHSVDAWTYSPGAPGLFGISATVDAADFVPARDALLAEIDQMKSSPVSAQELSKAVKQFISGNLSARKTMQGQANDLGGSWLAANDLNFSERYLAAVKRVTPTDLQRLARQYLTAENRTLYALLPTGTAPKPTLTAELSRDNPIQKIELANGLRVLLKEDHRLPFVDFRAVLQGGVLAETPANNGVTQLTAKLLLKGTPTRSAEEIATQIESIGGSIDTIGGYNSFGANAEVLSGDFSAGLALFADILLNPTFPPAALEREREVQLAGIRAQRDQLLQSASKMMRRGLFGDIGYGLDPLGEETSVAKIQVDDLRAFHEEYSRPNNCVLAIYGDIKTAEVRIAVEKAFGNWKPNNGAMPQRAFPGNQVPTLRPENGDSHGLSPSPPLARPTFGEERAGERRPLDRDRSPVTGQRQGEEAPSTPASATPSPLIKRLTEHRDKKQAVLVVGFNGISLRDPDRYALELLQEACSDLGSRLFMRVREKLGLAYYVGAQNFVGLVPGYFAFYAGTMPEKADVVEKELLLEADLLRAEGLSAEELQRAKAKIVGQRKIARQDLSALAMLTALDELYGLGYQHSEKEDDLYEAVTLDQIKSVANKYLNPSGIVIAVVKPQQ